MTAMVRVGRRYSSPAARPGAPSPGNQTHDGHGSPSRRQWQPPDAMGQNSQCSRWSWVPRMVVAEVCTSSCLAPVGIPRARPAGTQQTWMSLVRSWADESWTAAAGRCTLARPCRRPRNPWLPWGTHLRSAARPRSRSRPVRRIRLSSRMSGPTTPAPGDTPLTCLAADFSRQLPVRTRPGAALIWPLRALWPWSAVGEPWRSG
jgi:hypothetical protein